MASIRELETRVKSLENDMHSVKQTVSKVSDDTDMILKVVTTSKGIYGFVIKHGPRAIAFLLGLAVAKGWVSAEIANLIQGA